MLGLTFSPVQQMDKFTLRKDLFLLCRKFILQALHNRPQVTPLLDQTEQRMFQDLVDLLHEGEEVSDSLIYCASSIIGTLILIFPIPSIYLNKDDLDPWGPLWIYEFIIYLSFTYDYFCFLFFLLVVYCPQRI
ncbi:uncharacterized protein LOC143807307 isoform X2 [Ranitomeya variabilis]|uniref:uncharacterized protein LOC143807307 isoform X2 n=1 Tax=Ranitomeya variabilis TaxID=490064 RepID=UPI00405770AA